MLKKILNPISSDEHKICDHQEHLTYKDREEKGESDRISRNTGKKSATGFMV